MMFLSSISLLSQLTQTLTVLASPVIDHAPALEQRFGPRTVHSKALIDDSVLRKRSLEREEEASYSLKLHAHDQDKVNNLISDLSNPCHHQYGQWLSLEEAHEITKSDPDGVASILDYLSAYGVEVVSLEHGNRTLTFQASTASANAILGADYSVYTHNGQSKRGTRSISLPQSLHPYIARVEPGVDIKPATGSRRVSRRALTSNEPENIAKLRKRMTTRYESSVGDTSAAVAGQPVGPSLTGALKSCCEYYFPVCAKAQYHMPSKFAHTAGTSIGVMNFKPVCSNATDIKTAWQWYYPEIYNIDPEYLPTHVDMNVAGIETLTCQGSSPEADLDIQAVAPLVYPMKFYDFSGPNLNYFESAFSAIQKLGSDGVPKPDVLSVSYGATEAAFGSAHALSLCAQTDTIVLSGTTLVACTGDSGNQDLEFPALCPHWVAVGATDLDINASVTAPSYAEQQNDGWTYSSSGGFSEQNQTVPSWQKAAVAAYKNLYQDGLFGKYQNSAAVPDVSAMGRNWLTVIGGQGYLQGGTSLASPLFASMLAMINAQRVANNSGLIGFPLPAFYANTQLFRDVTKGNNNKDGNNGTATWPATLGWDPATGLGTPLFDRMSTFYQTAQTGGF